ncbi:hypothetical protein GALMADRAFT_148589 [Galerina marginata CBS 339.88]|uniref:Uncharacterized protein n=1 Tax=Galerina marginata (strain CBS 339.88) TaxID=685588 RepID=A0A067SFQ7_GALM3|nr:hypothetical protein GALMADRAFT_148589 [Galerina marginata CBS 339.88]
MSGRRTARKFADEGVADFAVPNAWPFLLGRLSSESSADFQYYAMRINMATISCYIAGYVNINVDEMSSILPDIPFAGEMVLFEYKRGSRTKIGFKKNPGGTRRSLHTSAIEAYLRRIIHARENGKAPAKEINVDI